MKRHRQLRARPRPSQLLALEAATPRRVQADALLTHCRELWLHGRWAELVDALELDDLAQHAHRDRLALMLASAQMALGAFGEAQRAVQQARQWDADPRLLARVLLAGVHNTLGRAAALSGQFERAWQHFASAAGPVAGARARTLGLQARGRQQLQALGLAPAPTAPPTATLAAPLQALSRRAEVLQQNLQQQGAQLQALHAQWQGELQQGLQSIENLQALRETLTAWGLPAGWPLQAADAARTLAALHWAHAQELDAVLEWDHGPLTALLAQALGSARPAPLHALCVPDAAAREAARATLARVPLGQRVSIFDAAETVEAGDGLSSALRQLAARLGGWQAPQVLVVALQSTPPEGLAWRVWQQLQPASLTLLTPDLPAASPLVDPAGRPPERIELAAGLLLLRWR